MARGLVARKPVHSVVVDMSSTNITTSWTQLQAAASFLKPACAVEVFNGSSGPIELGQGASSAEASLNYVVPPGGSIQVLAAEFAALTRLVGKSRSGGSITSGTLILNFFG
jgi:hypothetical protein